MRPAPVLAVMLAVALAGCGTAMASQAATARQPATGSRKAVTASLDPEVVPATCSPAPAGKKPPQQFLLDSYHADLSTRTYGDLTFDAGTVTAASGTAITIKRSGDGKIVTFAVPDTSTYQCGSTAASTKGRKVSVVSRGTTAVTIWPWTTQTPEVFKLAYHAVYDVARGNGKLITRTVDEGYIMAWSGKIPGKLTYRRGDGRYITLSVTGKTVLGNASGHLRPAQWRRCDLVQVITGGYLKIRVNNPATHPDGNPYQRIAAGGACR